jgi:hypothetical protein
MASKRHVRRKACGRKIAHKSAGAAYAAVIGHATVYGELLRYYHCRWCGKWHLGHNENNHDNHKLKLT